jgi:phage terminase large subunit-like protein
MRSSWLLKRQNETSSFVIPARPPWMAEVLETQEQFPVQAGIQDVDETIDFKPWTPASRRCDELFF